MKQCLRCSETKPLDAFHQRRSASGTGRKSYCKACVAQENAARYRADPSRILAVNAAWREANRDQHRAVCREWNAKNKDRVKGNAAAWYAANAAAGKDPSAWRRANPEKYSAIKSQWRRANKGTVNASTAGRHAKKLKATPAWADPAAMAAIYRLAEAATAETGCAHHVDHEVPLRSPLVCGLHCETNLRVITASINYAKGNRSWPDMP